MTHIEAKVRKTKFGYKGYIVAYDKGQRLWSQSAGIKRISQEDAIQDAEFMKKDIQLHNNL